MTNDSVKPQNSKRLLDYKKRVFSQGGKDGVIQRILQLIPEKDKWCVEFGAWNGQHLRNTRYLIGKYEYSAVLIEGDGQKQEGRNSSDTNLFDQPFYADITEARLEHFTLPLAGKSVVDVGCGIGRLAEAFDDCNCALLCVDGRPKNIQKLKELYPHRKSAVADLDSEDLFALGKFDVVFCYGLPYHLSDPLGFIKRAHKICKEIMVVETCIIDSELPEVLLVKEDQTNETQALQQFGCRPSSSYVIACLKLSGFKYIYQPTNLPDHLQFKYKRKNDHSYIRNGHLIRDIFVASHEVIENDNLRKCV